MLGFVPDTTDTRFDAVAAFSQTDWIIGTVDDPPNTVHNWFGAATLIAPDTVLMARHLIGDPHQDPSNPPADGQFAVRFRRHTDGTVGDTSSGWWSFHNVRISSYVYPDDPSIDMVMGILETPVTHINPIPVSPWTRPQPGDPIFIAGWGYDEFGSCSYPVGERNMLRVADTTMKDGFNWCFLVEYPSASNEGVSGPSCHDSGGGVIVENADGTLTLVGVVFNTSSAYAVDTFHVINPDYHLVCCFDPQSRCADADGNGLVEYADVLFIRANSGPCPPEGDCPADLNKDGVADIRDEVMVYGQMGTMCGVPDNCFGDVNRDGLVNGADLGVLTFEWGLHSCGITSDINGDGVVNGVDLGLLLATWGLCP